VTSQAKIDTAATARNLAIGELLIAFETAVVAGQQFDELARSEGIKTPSWPLAEVRYPAILQALDSYFPMVVERPQQIAEYHVSTPDGIVVEKYIK